MLSPSAGGSRRESGRTEDGGSEGDHRERGTGDRALPCALEMEMTNCSLHVDSRVDCVNCDGSSNRKSDDSAEVSVSLTGKRTAFMEGDDLYRLRDRKLLVEDKKRLCALSLGAAVLGIVLMISHAELCRLEKVGLINYTYSNIFILKLIKFTVKAEVFKMVNLSLVDKLASLCVALRLFL